MTAEDPISWFQNQGLQTQADLIEAWEENDEEAMSDIAGRQSNGVIDMFDNLEENYIEVDSIGTVTQHLISDGFHQMIARNIAVAIADKKEDITGIARYIKISIENSDEIGEISNNAVQMFLGEMQSGEYISSHENNELLMDIDNLIWRLLRGINESRIYGLQTFKYRLIEDTEFDEEDVEKLFKPIEENAEELLQIQHRNRAGHIYSNTVDLLSELDDIHVEIDTLQKRIRGIEQQFRRLSRPVSRRERRSDADFFATEEPMYESQRKESRDTDDELFD